MDQQLAPVLLEALADSRALAHLQWVGLAVFSTAFGVMLWTRWGSSEAMSKCVWLSVFAHVLLAIYFYSVELMVAPPGPAGGDSYVRVSLTTEIAEAASPPTPAVETPVAPPPMPMPQPDPPPMVAESPQPGPAPAPLPAAPADPPAPQIAATEPAAMTAEPPSEAVAAARPTTALVSPESAQPEERPTPPGAEERRVPARFTSSASPARNVSADQIPEMYRKRVSDDKLALVKRGGGNEQTEAAVAAALAWLAARQSADGRWDPALHGGARDERALGQERPGAGAKADTGISALALLALLGAGHTHLDGEYQRTVQRGLEYLLAKQRADGCLAGEASAFAAMYCHAMATLALSEAHAMTGDQRLRPALVKALRYTIAAQHPTQGGWRYHPGDQGDMSQFGWQVMSLKSAASAGLEAPLTTRQGMDRFLAACTSGKHGGLGSYRPREKVTPSMTAEALACRLFLGTRRNDAAVVEGAEYLMQHLPKRGEQPNLYYWYYGTLALYQVQGEHWNTWNQALQRCLLSTQESSGPEAGSWNTDSQWASYGGRVFTTSLAALCLESYYRFAPLEEEEVVADGGSLLGQPVPR